MNNKNNNKPAHEVVHESLLKMQEFGGSAIKPLAMYTIFFELLQDDKKSIMNRSKVRDIVDTYCALCNEFYIINHFSKKPRDDFYMSQERWDKYFLGQKARENSVKFLKRISTISYKNEQNPSKPINTVRMYTIDLEMLDLFVKCAEEIFEKSKAAKQKKKKG